MTISTAQRPAPEELRENVKEVPGFRKVRVPMGLLWNAPDVVDGVRGNPAWTSPSLQETSRHSGVKLPIDRSRGKMQIRRLANHTTKKSETR